MRDRMTHRMQALSQHPWWRGRASWWRSMLALLWAAVRFWLAQWLWGTALRLAHFPPPTKNLGAILALLSLAIFLWAAFGLVRAILALGLGRFIFLLVALFLIAVSFDVLTLPDGQSRITGLFQRAVKRAEQGVTTARDGIVMLTQAPDAFSFAYNGTRSAPQLPPGFPTPDPQATPVQAIAQRAGQSQQLATPVPVAAIAPTSELAELNSQFQVGDRVHVVNTGSQTLQARVQPDTQAAVAARFREGTSLLIIGGPKQADGYTWWQVRDDQGREGWCAAPWLEVSR